MFNNIKFKKQVPADEISRKKAIKNLRMLEDTTARHVAAVNRQLMIIKKEL